MIVNEDEDAPDVTDEQKYEEMLEKRQDRRTVSISYISVLSIIWQYEIYTIYYRGNLYMISWRDKLKGRWEKH